MRTYRYSGSLNNVWNAGGSNLFATKDNTMYTSYGEFFVGFWFGGMGMDQLDAYVSANVASTNSGWNWSNNNVNSGREDFISTFDGTNRGYCST